MNLVRKTSHSPGTVPSILLEQVTTSTSLLRRPTKMIAWWRLVLAALTVAGAFFLVRPATDMVLNAIRSRIHKRFRSAALLVPSSRLSTSSPPRCAPIDRLAGGSWTCSASWPRTSRGSRTSACSGSWRSTSWTCPTPARPSSRCSTPRPCPSCSPRWRCAKSSPTYARRVQGAHAWLVAARR